MKKFEFTGEVRQTWFGKTIRRIRALVKIELGWTVINPGDLGGWLEKEENLSHEGKAWVWGNAEVYGDAKVYGNAKVWGNAEVYGDAEVWGNAEVYGDAKVLGDAKVCGDAKVWGNANVYGNAKVCGDAFLFKTEHLMVIGPVGSRNDFTSFFRNRAGEIKVKCGCFFGTVDQFLSKVTQTHGDSKHAIVYRAAVTVALVQLDTTPYVS